MKAEFDLPIELQHLLQGMIRLSDGVRLIACTKGPAGVSIAKRWPVPTYFAPGELAALEASTHDLFGLLSQGEVAAVYVPPNEPCPIKIDSMTWSFHSYDAVRWETSSIKTGGAPAENIKVMADDVLRSIAPMAETEAVATQRIRKTNPKGSSRRGRPSYQKDDQPLMEEMHKLLISQVAATESEAATIVAPRAKGASLDSIIRRLRRRYPEWRKMLDKNGA